MTRGQLQQNQYQPLAPVRHAASKVPEVTAYFWVIKVLSAAQGEALADYLYHRFDPVTAAAVGASRTTSAASA